MPLLHVHRKCPTLYIKHVIESMGIKIELWMKLKIDNFGTNDHTNSWSVGGHLGHVGTKQVFLPKKRFFWSSGSQLRQMIEKCSLRILRDLCSIYQSLQGVPIKAPELGGCQESLLMCKEGHRNVCVPG